MLNNSVPKLTFPNAKEIFYGSCKYVFYALRMETSLFSVKFMLGIFQMCISWNSL